MGRERGAREVWEGHSPTFFVVGETPEVGIDARRGNGHSGEGGYAAMGGRGETDGARGKGAAVRKEGGSYECLSHCEDCCLVTAEWRGA